VETSSRAARQIVYNEARLSSIPIQTISNSRYSTFHIVSSLYAQETQHYPASEIEKLLVNNLYQKAARNCQLYLICAVLFIFGGMLSNLEGVIYEKFENDNENQENAQNFQIIQNAQAVQENTQNAQAIQNVQVNVQAIQNVPVVQNTENNENCENSQSSDKPNFLKRTIHQISQFGFIYHSGSAILAVLAFFMPILNVLLLKYWSAANSVNTLRPASSANNMNLLSPIYLFFLLISLLPLVSYAVTVCSVPCGYIRQQKPNKFYNLNQNNNNQIIHQGQIIVF